MWGAEATEQGDCSRIKGKTPHCCEKNPVIIYLLSGAQLNKQFANCCKGGVLASITQNPEKSGAAFQMSIGGDNSPDPRIAENFTLGVAGYTCGAPVRVPPSKFYLDHGRRKTQAVATWNVTCTYSQFRASFSPSCCVSLSAFYNSNIVQCPNCTCGCRGQPVAAQCVKKGDQVPVLKLDHDEQPKPVVKCTHHMCPIQVHWHVKQSYTTHWRVKMTVQNLNYVRNYSQWSLVVLHPNLRSVTQVFSVNYKPINVYGDTNETGMFYGIQYYNDMLLQAGKTGNVQTELLLHKDPGIIRFTDGWAFPRKISFNGEECVMPQPDDFPRLPNGAAHFMAPSIILFSLFFLLLL